MPELEVNHAVYGYFCLFVSLCRFIRPDAVDSAIYSIVSLFTRVGRDPAGFHGNSAAVEGEHLMTFFRENIDDIIALHVCLILSSFLSISP